jgi:hypothetical protein
VRRQTTTLKLLHHRLTFLIYFFRQGGFVLEKKLLAITMLAIVGSLSIAGCTVNLPSTSSATPTPTSTPTPPADYSSYFNTAFTSGNSIMVQPFTKGTNDRGDAVYEGVGRNSSLPESSDMTIVIELTQSQAEAKQLYDQTVAQKTNEGFTLQPAWVAGDKAESPYITEVWVGQQSVSGQEFVVMYYNNANVSPSWLFVTQAGVVG